MMDATRLRMLEAMGIDVYALRAQNAPTARTVSPARTDAPSSPSLAVISAKGVRDAERLARLFKHLPQVFGIAPETIEWIEAGADGELANAVDATAYLVFGAAMARSLGVQLSTMQQNTVTIAVTADPAQLPGSAADKRALWQTLKPIARRLRRGAA